MFSSRSFMVFRLTSRFLVYFEFIFVYDFRECSNLLFLLKFTKSVFFLATTHSLWNLSSLTKD